MITWLWRVIWGGCAHDWEDQEVVKRLETHDGEDRIVEQYMVQRCDTCGRYRREQI